MRKFLRRTLQLTAVAAFLMGSLTKAQQPLVQSSDLFVTTSDNVRIHLHRKVAANPAKIPVLLIHGTWCDARVWDFPGRSVMDYLAVRGYDVYALDMRGMGQSIYSGSYSNISLETRLQDAIAVASYIVTNTQRSPVVIGWSQGGVITGMLASYAAAHAPQQLVAGVGLFSVGDGAFLIPPALQPEIQGLITTAIASGTFKFALNPSDYFGIFGIDPVTNRPTISADAFATFLTLIDEDALPAILEEAGIVPFFTASPLAPAWGTIQVPALVVDGSLDPLVGADNAQALFNAMGSAKKQLIVFPRNSHGWFLEDNFNATQRVLNRFLAQFN